MRQVTVGGTSNNSLDNTATEYNIIVGARNWDTDINEGKQLVSTGGFISKLYVKLDAAPGSGKTWTFTIMVAGAASDLTCSITGTDTFGVDESNSIAVSAGNSLAIRATSSGSPTNSNATWSLIFIGTTVNESLFLGKAQLNNTQPTYSGIFGWFLNQPNEDINYQVIPTAGVIKNFYVQLNKQPKIGRSYTFTLRLNKANTALAVTLADLNQTANDTSDEITVAAGDKVGLKVVPSGTPSGGALAFGFTFRADIKGESCVMGQQGTTPSASDVDYADIVNSQIGFSATEIDHRQIGRACLLKKFYIDIPNTPPGGGGNAWDLTVRKNGVSTDLTVNLTGSNLAGNDTTNSALFADGDYMTLMIDPTSVPNLDTEGMHWGMVSVAGAISPSRTITRLTGIRHRFSAGRTGGRYEIHGVLGGISAFTNYQRRNKPQPWSPAFDYGGFYDPFAFDPTYINPEDI
ncbi:hypothetical protein LCGC14_0861610 [marine sediment metagenome]|uniref:Uncharacterized protein n=1 Tax=marine sediment metagenome TaxID=412755 RepID=A0A0F9PSQ7_9ZZZZ